MGKNFVIFFLAVSLLGCDAAIPPRTTPEKKPEPDVQPNKNEPIYQELLKLPPVPLDESKVHLWPGLANIGNTCFMNSSLKLMARQKELLKMLDAQSQDPPDVARVRQAFKAVINMIRLADKSPANTGDAEKDRELRAYILNQFRDRMSEVTSTENLKRFTTCKQEDANEFFIGISGLLDFNQDTPKNQMLSFFADRATLADKKIKNPRFRDSTEPLSLNVSLTKDIDTIGLIDEFTRLEDIAENTKSYLKKNYLFNLDKSLVMTVKTVLSNPADNSEKIREFTTNPAEKLALDHLNGIRPSQTDMNKLIGQSYPSKALDRAMPKANFQRKLNLVAVVVHQGSDPRGGHYYAYIKDADQNWYRQDDNSVSLHGPVLGKIEEKSGDEVNPQAYLYLYEEGN